jgi:hypothetical protein
MCRAVGLVEGRRVGCTEAPRGDDDDAGQFRRAFLSPSLRDLTLSTLPYLPTCTLYMSISMNSLTPSGGKYIPRESARDVASSKL